MGLSFMTSETIHLARMKNVDVFLNTLCRSKFRTERVYSFLRNYICHGRSNKLRPEFNPVDWVMEGDISRVRSCSVTSSNPQFSFALQPIVNPSCRRIVSFEALLRGKGGCSPLEILSSTPSEKIYAFDLQSKLTALELAGMILENDESISINLFPGSLITIPDSVCLLLENIFKNNLRPNQVIIEIIENELMSNIEELHSILKNILSAGIGLAIDDFGTGYSRLTLLSKIQPDKLKLDMDLITDIHISGPKQAMVSSLVSYCSDMGISVIAEGVEKVEEWCWLASLGIELFQGYLFSRPHISGVGNVFWPVKK